MLWRCCCSCPSDCNFHEASMKVQCLRTVHRARRGTSQGFWQSDRLRTLDLRQDECLRTPAKSVDSAMKDGTSAPSGCAKFLAVASEFYRVPRPGIRVLAARPRASTRVIGPPSFSGTTLPTRC